MIPFIFNLIFKHAIINSDRLVLASTTSTPRILHELMKNQFHIVYNILKFRVELILKTHFSFKSLKIIISKVFLMEWVLLFFEVWHGIIEINYTLKYY